MMAEEKKRKWELAMSRSGKVKSQLQIDKRVEQLLSIGLEYDYYHGMFVFNKSRVKVTNKDIKYMANKNWDTLIVEIKKVIESN